MRKPLLAILIIAFNANANDQHLIDALLDGLHQDAHEGSFQTYFARYSPNAIFLGTDKTERWTIEEFKTYAKPAFADGHGWTYKVIERNWEGDGNTRWFDEILFNEKLGHCRGTGVVQLISGEWKITHYALTMLFSKFYCYQMLRHKLLKWLKSTKFTLLKTDDMVYTNDM